LKLVNPINLFNTIITNKNGLIDIQISKMQALEIGSSKVKEYQFGIAGRVLFRIQKRQYWQIGYKS